MDAEDGKPLPPSSLVKYRVTYFTVTSSPDGRETGDYTVLEVGVPREIASDLGEIGRHIRDTHHGGDRGTFVKVVGIEHRGHEDAPSEPRVSLPARGAEEITALRFDKLLTEYGDGEDSKREFLGNECLTLDWDNTKPRADIVRDKLKAVGAGRGEYLWRASASGKGVHVRVPTPQGTTVYKAFDTRQQYRDDLKRVFLDLKRYLERHDPHDAGGILFDRKGEKAAGPWHKLKLR